jgi:hypothetical protein
VGRQGGDYFSRSPLLLLCRKGLARQPCPLLTTCTAPSSPPTLPHTSDTFHRSGLWRFVRLLRTYYLLLAPPTPRTTNSTRLRSSNRFDERSDERSDDRTNDRLDDRQTNAPTNAPTKTPTNVRPDEYSNVPFDVSPHVYTDLSPDE